MGELNSRRQNVFFNTDGAVVPCVNGTVGPADKVSFPAVRRVPLRTLEVELQPIQDLNGYDAPWPAGARNRIDASTVPDENKYIASATGATAAPSSTGGTWRHTDYIPVTPGEVLYFGQINASASSAGLAFYDGNKAYVSGYTSTQLGNSTNKNKLTVPEGAAYLRHSFRIDTGYNVDWATTVYITLNSLTHQWYPYENICPIYGHSGADVYQRSKNYADINLLNAGNVVVTNGEAVGTASSFNSKFNNGIPGLIIPSGQFTMSLTAYGETGGTSTSNGIYFAFVYTDGTSSSVAWPVKQTEPLRKSITSTVGKTIQKVSVSYGSAGSNVWHVYDWQIEPGDTMTAFEPYKGTTIDTAFYEESGTDIVPYLERPSAGGNREFDTLVGGTIAWNQLMPREDGSKGNLYFDWQNGKLHIHGTSGTADSTYSLIGSGSAGSGIPLSERAILLDIDFPASASISFVMRDTTNGVNIVYYNYNHAVDSTIVKTRAGATVSVYFIFKANSTIDITFRLNLFDLTQMFGSAIADRAYTMERSTAGSGIAWLKSYGFFQEDSYPYNAGELMSVKTSAHVMRDANGSIIGNYALDSSLELYGFPKLDADNNLYYDGDTYESDGTVTRNINVGNMGSQNWGDAKTSEGIFSTTYSSRKYGSGVFDVFTKKYVTYTAAHSTGSNISTLAADVDKMLFVNAGSGTIYIKDSAYTNYTADQVKAALSGEPIIFKKATSSTESAAAFTHNQAVDANGTEKYVDERTIPMPVGHQTQYFRSDYIGVVYPDAPGVVYGAILDDANNTLTVDMVSVDMDTLDWNYTVSRTRFSAPLPLAKSVSAWNSCKNYCSVYGKDSVSSSGGTDKVLGIYSTNVYVRDLSYTGKTAFINALTAENAQLVYELATPLVYQLSQEQVNSIKGMNNIWSNAGRVKVTYRTN